MSALHKYCDYFPGGTLALDNDVALKITHIDDLFGIFDDMRTKAYGFGLDGRCVPEEHKEPDIPDDFCERNSGLIFFGDAARSKEMTRNWLDEMRDRPTNDGHDQGPLRRVLWRRRDVLYDLAPNVQCRRCTKRYGVDPCEYLAWHSHRPKRLQVFTNKTLACGFRDDRLRPESRR